MADNYPLYKSKASSGADVWILSDIHFGVKNNSRFWLDLMTSYFDDWFFPIVDEEASEEDILMVCGDIFEVRKSIHQLVLNRALRIFKDLSKRFKEIHVVTGNHDIFLKNSTEVTVLDTLDLMDNVHVYKEPAHLDLNGTDLFIMPWIGDEKEEARILRTVQADYAFCHITVDGARVNHTLRKDEGVDTESFSSFRMVYTGHIHFRQRFERVNIVGNPYEVIRADAGNIKGIYVLDPDTGEETFYENDFSPKYVQIDLGSEEDLDARIGEIKEMCRGNFLDVHVPSDIMSGYTVNFFLLEVNDICLGMEVFPYHPEQKELLESEEVSSNFKDFDILSLCIKSIEELDMEDDETSDLKERVENVYNRAKEQEDL